MSSNNAGAPLDGISVLDLSDGIGGQFASRLLADWGARVVLVEAPAGTATRRLRVAVDPRGEGAPSPLFTHLNLGKRVVAVNRAEAAGAGLVERLLDGADVVVVDGVGFDHPNAVAHRWPRLITTTIRDFGSRGPYADWSGTELIHQALSGLMYTTGHPGRRPLFGFGHRAYYSAGAAAAVAVLAALRARDRSGRGQEIEISVHEVAASMSQNLVTQFGYSATNPERGKYVGASGLAAVADGWVVLFCPAGRWPALCTELGLTELITDPRFASFDQLVVNWESGLAALRRALVLLPADQVVSTMQNARCMAAQVLTPPEVLAAPHLTARGYWRQLATTTEPDTVLGAMYRSSNGWIPTAAGPHPVDLGELIADPEPV